jgi:hypothetical protein
VKVGVVIETLAPGVQHRDEADRGAEMLGVGGDRAKRLRRGAEQDLVNHLRVAEGHGGELVGHGENDMEVLDRQQLRLSVGEPLGALELLALGAVPVAAGVVGDLPPSALSALLHMAALCGGAAGRNVVKHAPFDGGEVTVSGGEEIIPVCPNDVGHLERWTSHETRSRSAVRFRRIEGTLDRLDRSGRDVGVGGGGTQARMPQDDLDLPDVGCASRKPRRHVPPAGHRGGDAALRNRRSVRLSDGLGRVMG